MASKRRVRQRECGNKTPHKTEFAARQELRTRNQARMGRMHVYKCNFCGCYHVGHIPGKNLKAMRAKYG